MNFRLRSFGNQSLVVVVVDDDDDDDDVVEVDNEGIVVVVVVEDEEDIVVVADVGVKLSDVDDRAEDAIKRNCASKPAFGFTIGRTRRIRSMASSNVSARVFMR